MVSVSKIWSKSFPTISLHVFKESIVWFLAIFTSWLVLCWWFLEPVSSKPVLVAASAVLVSSAVIVRGMSRQKPLVVDSGGMVEDDGCPSPESFSVSECINPSASEDSEAETDWGPGREWSDDGSITDEESLIEIEIPSGHYIGCGRNEVVSEIEEENLIEIDISMGSIKCTKGYELNQ